MPVCGLLSQIGGTWWKPARRIGVPITLCLTITLAGISVPRAILSAVFLGIAATLPFTLGKGDIRKWWQFAWIFVAGYLLGLPSALIHPSGALLALVPCLAQGILGTLSNLPATAKFFQWKMVEGISWIAVSVPYLLIASGV